MCYYGVQCPSRLARITPYTHTQAATAHAGPSLRQPQQRRSARWKSVQCFPHKLYQLWSNILPSPARLSLLLQFSLSLLQRAHTHTHGSSYVVTLDPDRDVTQWMRTFVQTAFSSAIISSLDMLPLPPLEIGIGAKARSRLSVARL